MRLGALDAAAAAVGAAAAASAGDAAAAKGAEVAALRVRIQQARRPQHPAKGLWCIRTCQELQPPLPRAPRWPRCERASCRHTQT